MGCNPTVDGVEVLPENRSITHPRPIMETRNRFSDMKV